MEMLTQRLSIEERKLGPPSYSTEKARAASETMRNLEPVGKEWMALWMKQWGY